MRIGSQDGGLGGWIWLVYLRWVSLCEDWLARWACDGVDRCVGRVRGAFCED